MTLLSGRYDICGIDLFPSFVERMRRRVPTADLRIADAAQIPWADGEFDAALCLDVLEHVPDPRAVMCELARVVRPGGLLVASVPHAGVLAPADSLNVYQRLLPSRDIPTDDPSWSQKPHHDHYTLDQMVELLAPAFAVERAHFTGTGIAELVNLPLLVITRGVSPRLRPIYYRFLVYIYAAIAMLDDLVPCGRYSYNLMIRARRL